MDFANIVVEETIERSGLTAAIDGRRDIRAALSAIWQHLRSDGAVELPPEVNISINSEITSCLFAGAILAVPGYLVFGSDFIHLVGIFISSQPLIISMMVRQFIIMVTLAKTGDNDAEEFADLAAGALCATAYAAVCTIFYALSPALHFFYALHFGLASWTAFCCFWCPVLLLVVWFNTSSSPWTPFLRALALYRAANGTATRFRDIARWMLIVGIWNIGEYVALRPLHWLLYRFYHRHDKSSEEFPWLCRPYKYKKLKSRRDQPVNEQKIRLLRIPRHFIGETRRFYGLLPDWPGHCHLQSFPLGEAPPYDCISYTWGSPDLEEKLPIHINAREMLVGKNVFQILCARRSWRRDQFLWIDSICINQRNEKEKARQIPMMKEIYGRAQRVIVHIQPTGDSQKGASISAVTTNMAGVNILAGNRVGLGTISNIVAESYAGSREWEHFLEFLSDPWFNRAWVIQEVAVASSVEIVVCDQTIDWSLVKNAIVNAYASGAISLAIDQENQPVASARHFLEMLELRKLIEVGQTPDLATVLGSFYSCQATQPKDKIWALLGVSRAAPGGPEPITLKYTDPEVRLVRRVARYLVERDDYLRVIFAAGIGWRAQQDGVPSWVPDWTRPPANPWGYRLSGYAHDTFSASGTHKSHLRVSADGMRCSALGWEVGQVTDLTVPFRPDDYRHGELTVAVAWKASTWLLEARLLAASKWIECQPEDEGFDINKHVSAMNEAFWTTITSGRDKNNNFVTPEYLRKVDAWERLVMDPENVTRLHQGMSDRSVPFAELAAMTAASTVTPAFNKACWGARFGLIDGTFASLLPAMSRVGDRVCILAGAEVPVLVRPVSPDGSPDMEFELVGECFVHGMMKGEISDQFGKERTFVLC